MHSQANGLDGRGPVVGSNHASSGIHKGETNSLRFRETNGNNSRRKQLGTANGHVTAGKSKKSNERKVTSFIVENQIKISLFLLQCLATVYLAFPGARDTIVKFVTISYRNPRTGEYLKGVDDIYLVAFWLLPITILRVVFMDYIFIPYARRNGVKTQKGLVRFAEQGWLLVYYSVFWSLGMYIMYNSDYWLDLTGLWRDWPRREVPVLTKWYYLVQFSFWLQQVFVLHIEERRKDHYQMFIHHIITLLLMLGSYIYHFTNVGNNILCLMDVVDILLPLAKMLKYLGYQTICDVMFGIFMLVWFVGRHVFFPMILHSIGGTHMVETMPYGCHVWTDDSTRIHSNIWSGTDETCFSPAVRLTFLGLLVILQIIAIIWFFMICRVAAKVLRGGEAEDTRSDDEGEHEIDDVQEADTAGLHKRDLADRDRILLGKIGKEGLKNVSTGCSGVVSNGNLSGTGGVA